MRATATETAPQVHAMSWPVVLRVGRLFVPYWLPLVGVFSMLSLSAYFDALMPQLYKTFVDDAVPKQDVERIGSLALQVVGVLCLSVVMKVGREALTTRVSEHLARALRENLFRHLQALPLHYFTQDRSAEFAALFNHELTGATGGVCRLIFSTAQNLLSLGFLLRAMWEMDWRLAVGSLALVPGFYLPSLYMTSRMRAYKQRALESRTRMNTVLAESLSMGGIILARTFGQPRLFFDRFTAQSATLSRTTEKANLLHTTFFQVLLVGMGFISILVYLLAAGLFLAFHVDTSDITMKAGQVVAVGGITMGTVVAFSSYIGRLYGPLSDLSGVHIQLATCSVSFERIFHYFDLPLTEEQEREEEERQTAREEEEEADGTTDEKVKQEEEEKKEKEMAARAIPRLRVGDVVGDVRFENVSFTYPQQQQATSMPLDTTRRTTTRTRRTTRRRRTGDQQDEEEGEEEERHGEEKEEEEELAEDDNDPHQEKDNDDDDDDGDDNDDNDNDGGDGEGTGTSRGSRWVLSNVSAHFRAGEVTAIVGANGSGKSTMALLLMGFLRPQRGEVYLDGHPLSHLLPGPPSPSSSFSSSASSSSSSLPGRHPPPPPPTGAAADDEGVTSDEGMMTAHMGYLAQEPYLLDDTVAVNLRLGRPDASLEELHDVCRVVGIHDKVSSLPLAYETVVGHRAACLSGGEKQKLAIARVLLKRPKVLVLDECESSLDPASRKRIDGYIRERFASCTRIIIAHRLDTVAQADAVVLLHQGRVVACGPPAALLAQRGGAVARFFAAETSA